MGRKRGNGEHTTFRLPDGRWAMEGYVPVGPHGARKRIRRQGPTLGVAKARFNAALEAAREGLTAPRDPGLTTVGGWTQYYLTEIASPRLKPGTIVGYQHALDTWISPTIGPLPLAKLTIEHVEQVQKQIEDAGRARSSVVQARTVLNQALDEAVRREHLVRNVVRYARAPRKQGKEGADAFTPEEARTILAQARMDGHAGRWFLALALGLRQGECLGLRWSDCNLDGENPSLTITRTLRRVTGVGLVFTEPKTRASRRTIRLSPDIVTALREHRAQQNRARLLLGTEWHDADLVFTTPLGTPLDPANDRKAWIALLNSADVRYLKLHAARHTTATLLLNAGQELRVVQDLLGHSSIQVTADIYGHVTGKTVQTAVGVITDLLVGQVPA